MTRAAIPILTSIAELAPSCDAWIVDIWGVMHNGRRAFEAAGEACRRFRAAGGLVVLLSNAPRPFTAVIGHMTSLGVDPAAYDTGVTSGDATRALIEAWAGRRLLHIGPERDLGPVRRPRRQDGPGRGRGGDRLLGPLRRHQGDARRLRGAVRPPRRPPPADDLRQSGSGGGARRDARLLRRLARRGLCRQGRGGALRRQAAPADLRAHLRRDCTPRRPACARRSASSPSATASIRICTARMQQACARSSSPAPCTCRASSARARSPSCSPRAPSRPIAALPALVW